MVPEDYTLIKDLNIQNDIYFLNRTSDMADIAAYAQANNITLFHMDGLGVFRQAALLQNLGAVIRSPISHEQSWDKFRADITDLFWITPGNGFFLVYENHRDLLACNPEDWISFLEIALDATTFWKQTKTPLYIFFYDPARVRKANKAHALDNLAPRPLAAYVADFYFLDRSRNMTEIISYAREKNVEFFHLDGSEITSREDLLSQVGDILRFPDYYGQNWDALYDCMTDLNHWIAPQRDGYILFYEGYQKLLFSNPREWSVFLKILLDTVEFWKQTKTPMYIFLQFPTSNKTERTIPERAAGGNEAFNKLESDSVFTNPELFTQEKYREFMVHINNLGERLKHLHTAMSHYPKEKRFGSPESDEWDVVFAKYKQTAKSYRLRLPLHSIAICPYCGTSVVKPFDHFSLLGLYDHLNIDYTYVGIMDKRDDLSLGRHCAHALFTMQFVNFNGREPDDLPVWAAKHLHLPSSYRLSSAPYVLVWPLIARRTSAVIHALPIGRYDDPEPRHHYTSYLVTYFTDGKNSNISNFWNTGKDSMPGPNLYGNIYKDYDLSKWVKAERLFWVDSRTKNIVNQPITNFPYANIQPQGWYRIKEDCTINGPHPYENKWIWSGKPPHHSQAFPSPIDV